jgi:hypothetical protein
MNQKRGILILFVSVLFLTSVSASNYDNCSIYGNCKTIPITSSSGSGNASTGNCPLGYAVQNSTTNGVQCVSLAGGSMDYAYVDTNIQNNYTALSNLPSLLTTYNASYVPYTGATGDVNLGNYNLNASNFYLNGSISGLTNFTTGNYAFNLGFINGTSSYLTASRGNFIYGYNNIQSNANITGYMTSIGAYGGDAVLGSINVGIYGANSTYYLNSNSGAGGAFTQGNVYFANGGTNNTGYISSTGNGAFAQGAVSSPISIRNNQVLFVSSSNNGAFAQGSIQGASGVYSSISSTAVGGFAQGANVCSALNSSCYISSTGNGAFAQGATATGGNKRMAINSFGSGSFAQGYTYGGNITASGNGAFAHGALVSGGYNEYIVASGENSLAIGSPNLTISGTNSMGFGKNLDITGTNSIGFGLGSTTLKRIADNNYFVINDGDMYLNGTSLPYFRMGNAKELSLSYNGTDFVINPKNVGSGKTYNKGQFVSDDNITAPYFIGNGQYLTGVGGGNSSWNQSFAETIFLKIADMFSKLEITNMISGNKSDIVTNVSLLTTYNSTYNNMVDNQCAVGAVVNGTNSTGGFTCVTPTATVPPQTIYKSDVITTNSTGLAWVTLYTIPLTAQTNYTINCYMLHSSNATTSGIRYNMSLINAPDFMMVSEMASTTATAFQTSVVTGTTKSMMPIAVTASLAYPAYLPDEVNIFVDGNANTGGNAVFQFSGELAGLLSVVGRGSYCEVNTVI